MRWLQRKAQAHVNRDRRRWQKKLLVSEYKRAIHAAVLESGGRDFYTGEQLDWWLLSKYDNTKSKASGTAYKRKFAVLPTVDHANPDRDGNQRAILNVQHSDRCPSSPAFRIDRDDHGGWAPDERSGSLRKASGNPYQSKRI